MVTAFYCIYVYSNAIPMSSPHIPFLDALLM